MKLEHFNISGPIELLEEAKRFYVDALGLTEGPRPEVPTRGYWLYSDDVPIVHLNEQPQRTLPELSGYLDHIALACSDVDDMVSRLERMHIAHTVNRYPAVNLTQIFLRDPAGTGVELNFR